MRKKGIKANDVDGFLDILLDEWIETFTDKMQERTGALYLDMFDASEIKGIAVFYHTPAGQALLRETPTLMLAGAQLGRQVGMEAAQEVNGRLKERLKSENIEFSEPGTLERILDAL